MNFKNARDRGFTLIELMIVVAIIAVIAAIAIPNLLSSRLNSNEAAAIATLQKIISAQTQFQATAKADQNRNGIGEFGFFPELSGGAGVRGGSVLNPPVLSTAFRVSTANGVVTRAGYNFVIGLPAASGFAVDFNGIGFVDGDLAEGNWVCYAWPVAYGSTGNRTFFVNQAGDLIGANDPRYTGRTVPFTYGAAFAAPGSVHSITGTIAGGTIGRDANRWRQVG